MDIEKSITLAAPATQVWQLILDPEIMARCVPGVASVTVVSESEYLASIKVKISFVSANFKIRTQITERQENQLLRCEGQGEEAALASKLKHASEIHLTQDGDSTTLRIASKVDVFGRIGSMGLSAMKTKVDRMWDEFCVALQQRIEGVPQSAAG